MVVGPGAEHVRTLVFQTLLELDVHEDALEALDERILLDEGKYIARSYQAAELMAMWLVDVGIVQFYDGDGNMLRTINLLDEVLPRRMAA